MKMNSIIKTAFLTLVLSGGGAVNADQMFLKATNYRLAEKEVANVELINGSFERSMNIVSLDRIRDVRLNANGSTSKLDASQWTNAKASSFLSFNSSAAGTYTVGVSTKPNVIEMTAAEFKSYMDYEGMVDALAAFEKGNELATVRERYSKHVRAFLQVGDVKTDDYKKPLGHPLEIILQDNPYNLKFGKVVNFQVLLNGKPLANQVVKASYDGFHAHNSTGGHVTSYNVRTDEDGRASFLLSNKAVWYISLINMRSVDDSDADYESNWATVTFDVK